MTTLLLAAVTAALTLLVGWSLGNFLTWLMNDHPSLFGYVSIAFAWVFIAILFATIIKGTSG